MSVRQGKVHGRRVWQTTMRVVTVSIVILLVLVTAASAECAWVLWSRATVPGTGVLAQFDPILARESRAECEERRGHYWARWDADPDKRGIHMSYQCLPDTVDPRGPKGK